VPAGLHTLSFTTDRRSDQSPEGGATVSGTLGATREQGAAANDRRARAIDEMVRLGGGETPWRANPGRGCGVKQTHKARAGASRRGRAKRRGRNVGELGMLAARGLRMLMPRWGCKTPREVLPIFGSGAGLQQLVLWRGGEAHERMNPS
jgi:hypothetical protein